MSRLPLSPQQAELSDRIFQTLRQAAEADLRSLADLLASKEDRQLLGKTEFEVRDLVHRIGAKPSRPLWTSGKGVPGVQHDLPAFHGRPASSVRPKTVQSLVGTFSLERGYYHCRSCGKGTVPWDEALAVAPVLTAGAANWSASPARDSFAEAADVVLRKLAGLRPRNRRWSGPARRSATTSAGDRPPARPSGGRPVGLAQTPRGDLCLRLARPDRVGDAGPRGPAATAAWRRSG